VGYRAYTELGMAILENVDGNNTAQTQLKLRPAREPPIMRLRRNAQYI
jgi:hypothetical protein